MQIDELRAAGCERIFTETASGARRDRPELARALDYAREGDTLVVWKLDRMARSTRQLIETVEMLADRGIELRSLTEAIDTSTAGGKLVFTIFAALAEFERSLIAERTREGLKAARARGARLGRPAALTDDDIAVAQSLREAGHTMSEIARRLGVCRRTLYNHLPRPLMVGAE